MRGDCRGTWLIMLGFMDLGWPRGCRRCNVEVEEWISNLIPYLIMDVITFANRSGQICMHPWLMHNSLKAIYGAVVLFCVICARSNRNSDDLLKQHMSVFGIPWIKIKHNDYTSGDTRIFSQLHPPLLINEHNHPNGLKNPPNPFFIVSFI